MYSYKKGTLAKLFLLYTCIKAHVCYICLLIWFEFIVPLGNFSLILRCHHYRRRAANYDLYLALMTIELWGLFSVPHLLWHRASVYNGHLRGRATMTPVAERLAFRTLTPKLLHSRPCSNRLRYCWGHCTQ